MLKACAAGITEKTEREPEKDPARAACHFCIIISCRTAAVNRAFPKTENPASDAEFTEKVLIFAKNREKMNWITGICPHPRMNENPRTATRRRADSPSAREAGKAARLVSSSVRGFERTCADRNENLSGDSGRRRRR
ncbi:MAG: hypothetical protein IKQ92_08640 [Clostridia bacterium]|nr:hypothetical protein [Clostridia bacterium]